MPAPSPITNPFAPASNGVECVGERAPIAENFAKVAGSSVRSVAPTSMTSTKPAWSCKHASSNAAIEDAHAASVVWFGPCRSRRFTATRHHVREFTGHGILVDSGASFYDRGHECVPFLLRKASLQGLALEGIRPDPEIREVPEFAAKRIGDGDACSLAREGLVLPIPGMFQCHGTDGHSPLLSQVDLGQRPGRHAVTSPIEFVALDLGRDASIGLPFWHIPRPSIRVKIRGIPSVDTHLLDRDLPLEHIRPERFHVRCIWHQRGHPDDGNRFESAISVHINRPA